MTIARCTRQKARSCCAGSGWRRPCTCAASGHKPPGGSSATARPAARPACTPRNTTSASSSCAGTYRRRSSTPRCSNAQSRSPLTELTEVAVEPDPADPRDETPEQRDDRNLIELLQELRVARPGVQVLFGFLLALPLSTRFVQLHLWQRGLYTMILVASAVATALLLGPVAYHPLGVRPRPKEHLGQAANAMVDCRARAPGLG